MNPNCRKQFLTVASKLVIVAGGLCLNRCIVHAVIVSRIGNAEMVYCFEIVGNQADVRSLT